MCFNLVQWKRTIRSAIFDGVGSPGYCARCRYDYSYSPRACTEMGGDRDRECQRQIEREIKREGDGEIRAMAARSVCDSDSIDSRQGLLVS